MKDDGVRGNDELRGSSCSLFQDTVLVSLLRDKWKP